MLATAHDSDPLLRSSYRLEGSIIISVTFHGVPKRAAFRLFESDVLCASNFRLHFCGNGNVSVEGLFNCQRTKEL